MGPSGSYPEIMEPRHSHAGAFFTSGEPRPQLRPSYGCTKSPSTALKVSKNRGFWCKAKIYDKDGNDVTRERMLPKVIKECRVCTIPIKVIIEDLEAGMATRRCPTRSGPSLRSPSWWAHRVQVFSHGASVDSQVPLDCSKRHGGRQPEAAHPAGDVGPAGAATEHQGDLRGGSPDGGGRL